MNNAAMLGAHKVVAGNWRKPVYHILSSVKKNMNTAYLKFCPKLKEIYETGKSLDENGNAVEVGSLSPLNNIRVIRELILQERPSKTLEIGLAYGGSALTFLSTLKEVSPNNFHHTAIDPFQKSVWGGSSLKAIQEVGFSDNFTLHEDYSALILPDLIRKNLQFDLIYIDESHLFEDVFLDFYYSSKLLKIGGVMLFDDCRDRHVLKVIKFINANYTKFLTEIDYGVVDDPDKPLFKKVGNFLGIRQLCGFKKTSEVDRKWNSPYFNF